MREPVSPEPAVSVIIPSTVNTNLARAVEALRSQSLTNFEVLIAGEKLTPLNLQLISNDNRFNFIHAPGLAPFRAINLGLDHARGTFLTILDPRDTLAPTAFESLINTARSSRLAAAFSSYYFCSPLGTLPGDPLKSSPSQDVPNQVSKVELAACKLFPLHAMVVQRSAMNNARLRSPVEDGGDHEWLIQLAANGVKFAYCNQRLAAVEMDTPQTNAEIMRRLVSHASVIAAASESASEYGPDRDAFRSAALHSHAQAAVLLQIFEETLERIKGLPDADTALAHPTSFENLFAQWWQRLRFLGQPPRHVLAAAAGSNLSSAISQEQIAQDLVAQCELHRPIVLLGLGRNGRLVARVLNERGMPIVGRDDGLNGMPHWAAKDGVTVTMAQHGFDPDVQYIMTLTDDEAYMAKLPTGLTVMRWSQSPQRLFERLTREAIDSLIRGQAPSSVRNSRHQTLQGAAA